MIELEMDTKVWNKDFWYDLRENKLRKFVNMSDI